jgi:nitrogen fixation protein FixH
MGMSEMKTSAQLSPQANGSYAGQLELGSGGTWQVTITAEQGGKLILTKRLNVSATGGM